MGFSGAWPASWPTGVALQLHITEGDEHHARRSSAMNFAPPGGLIL